MTKDPTWSVSTLSLALPAGTLRGGVKKYSRKYTQLKTKENSLIHTQTHTRKQIPHKSTHTQTHTHTHIHRDVKGVFFLHFQTLPNGWTKLLSKVTKLIVRKMVSWKFSRLDETHQDIKERWSMKILWETMTASIRTGKKMQQFAKCWFFFVSQSFFFPNWAYFHSQVKFLLFWLRA